MDPEIIVLKEVRQRERQIPYVIIYMWNLKKKKKKRGGYVQNRNRLTNIENKLTVTKGKDGGRRDKSGI